MATKKQTLPAKPAEEEKSGPVKLMLHFSAEMVKQIEDYRFENRINSRVEAIRMLIQKGLDTQ